MRRLLVAPLLVLSLTFGLTRPLAAAEPDPLIPAEANSIAVYNLRQIIDCKLFQVHAIPHLKPFLEKEGEFQDRMKSLGIDPLKDVAKITTASWVPNGDLKAFRMVGIVHGKFDLQKFFDMAQNEAKNNGERVAIVNEGAFKLVKLTLGEAKEGEKENLVYGSLASEDLLILSNDKKGALDVLAAAKAKNAKPAMSKSLAKLFLDQDESASFFQINTIDLETFKVAAESGVSLVPSMTAEATLKLAEKTQSYAVVLKATDTVEFQFTTFMESPAAAEDMATAADELLGKLKGFLPILVLQQQKLEGIVADVSSTLRTKVKGNTVTVSFKVTPEAIAQLSGIIDE